ncbi:ABC transporter substrate-binding protein [Nocardioides sp. T5]|uniref:ABC transporter substrate-binding protein n=1 Tax=Nocardioides sp. T5 TaxID=3400182 RepID=UPI003A8613AA
MTRTRSIRFGAVVVAGLLGLTACGGDGNASETEKGGLTEITVGTMPIVTNSVLALGVEKGFFEEEGLDVTLETGQGGAALLPAVINGQYDFAFSNNVSILTARAQGMPVKIVAAASSAGEDPAPADEAIVASASSGITSLDQVEDTTVAVNQLLNMVEVADRVALEKAGADLDSIEFIEMGFPDMPAALANGKVDVAHVAEPFLTQAVADGATILSAPYREVAPDVFMSSWFTSENTLAKSPEVVEKFQAALEKSRQYAVDHTDEVRSFIPTFIGMDADLADKIALGNWPAGLPEETSLQAWFDAAVTYGVFTEDQLSDPTEVLAD